MVLLTQDVNGSHPGRNLNRIKFMFDSEYLFTKGMGMCCTDGSKRNLLKASGAYSAVIHDVDIERIFFEV